MISELILVIDDRETSRSLIIDQVLAPLGHRFLVAEDGEQGARQVHESWPDLIILNPACAGPALLAELGDRPDPPAVILCLPEQEDNPALEVLRLAAQGVVKPLGAEEMRAAVARALQARRLARAQEQAIEQLQYEIRRQRILQTIGQAVGATSDRQTAMNRLTEAAAYLTGGDEGLLLLRSRDEDKIRLCAYLAPGEQHARADDRPFDDPLLRHALDSGEPTLLSGQEAAAASPANDSSRPALALIDVPIKLRGELLGALRVTCFRCDAFTRQDLTMLAVLAHYAALAIENADLRDEIQARAEHMAICEIGASFGATLRLDSLLEMVMQVALRLVDAERGYLVLRDEETGTFVARQVVAPGLAPSAGAEFPFGGDIVQQVLREGKPVCTRVYVRSQNSRDDGFRAVICVPIPGTVGIVGAIYVDHSNLGSFTDYHQDVLNALSINASAAVENARLFSQVEVERRKLEAVIRGTDQPVIVTDIEGTVLLMNQAAHLAFSTRRSRATGMLLPQVSDHSVLANLYAQARVSGQVQHGEISFVPERTFSATVTPIPGVGFVTMMQDVTEFKQLSQMKSEFVATVSHDMRSPLSVVLGFLSMMGQAGPLTDQQRDFIATAEQEVRHLLGLTGDLLDLGRVEAEMDLVMAPCEMHAVLEKSLEHWRNQTNGKHRLLVDLPAEEVWVSGNAGRLRQVVDNLLNNAIKYTPDGGVIDVSLRHEGAEVVLRVSDTGIGIAPANQPYIFDRFYRVRNKQTEDIEGTGLGLAIVKSIVERHGGRVWVESTPGEGSTFGVVFPALPAA